MISAARDKSFENGEEPQERRKREKSLAAPKIAGQESDRASPLIKLAIIEQLPKTRNLHRVPMRLPRHSTTGKSGAEGRSV